MGVEKSVDKLKFFLTRVAVCGLLIAARLGVVSRELASRSPVWWVVSRGIVAPRRHVVIVS
jgi:hypothetical protein